MSTKRFKKIIKESLKGPVFTVFTSFDSDGKINYFQIENYLNFLYDKGVRNFYVMPYNSRYSQLREKEIFDLNKFVIKYLKKLDNSNFVIVSDCIHGPTSLSLDYGNDAFLNGADMFASIVREKYFSDNQILKHYNLLSNHLEMPLLVHEMPFLSGYNATNFRWPLSLLEEIKDIEYVLAIKEDAKDEEYGKKVIEILEPDVKVIFAGKKRYIKDLYQFGLTSYLNGTSILNPKIAFLFWESLLANDEKKISAIFEKIEDPFWNNIVSEFGWHRSNKAILQASGLMDRFERLPMIHLNDEEYKIVEDFYNQYKDFIMYPENL